MKKLIGVFITDYFRCTIHRQVNKEGENPARNAWIFACMQDVFDERPYFPRQNGGQGKVSMNVAPSPKPTPGMSLMTLRL